MNDSFAWRSIVGIPGTCRFSLGNRKFILKMCLGPSPGRWCGGSDFRDKVREGETPMVKGVLHFMLNSEKLSCHGRIQT